MFNLKKILLPVDFSGRSNAIVPYVKAFASQLHSQFLVLHVEHGPVYDTENETGFLCVQAARVEELKHIRHELRTFLSDELNGQVIQRNLVEGDAAAKIVEYAHANEVDLIMMPTHGYGPYKRFLLGSVTTKVLNHCDCPVWTEAHIEEAAKAVPCRKIACAIDLGPHSEQVLLVASNLASALAAELLVIHVAEAPKSSPVHGCVVDPGAQMVQEAGETIAKLLKKLNVKAEVGIESGSITELTERRVAAFGADLLVIGRHAAKGLGARLHSHTNAFIRESLCPVVSV